MSKEGKYERVYNQLQALMPKSTDPIARMATIASVLHNKMNGFFWTGFYIIREGELVVGPYQGSVACMVLAKNRGVCWTAVNEKKTIVVPNVHEFEGHIACDDRSNSEIVVPVFNSNGNVIAVLDVDSKNFANFDVDDAFGLERIVGLIN
jgi:L-methionine (R)-S-oxide reductase